MVCDFGKNNNAEVNDFLINTLLIRGILFFIKAIIKVVRSNSPLKYFA